MNKEKKDDFVTKKAKELFYKTWDYIDKEDRAEDDELNMIHAAHASRCLWGEAGGPLQWERGEWLISRVYQIVGSGDRALYHGKNA